MNTARAALVGCAALLTACGSDFFVRGEDDSLVEPLYFQETFIQEALPQVDLLWVIDNTLSMADEHQALAGAFPAFVDALEGAGLAYHLAVVTTEVSGEDAGALQGDPWIITPALADPAAAFGAAAAVGTGGLGPEAGIAAMVMALSEPLRSEDNRGFRRPGAALHVVVVSDDDDDSEGTLGVDPVDEALSLLAEESSNGRPAFLSAVVGDRGVGCRGVRGEAQPGDAYADVAEATGGVVESICDGALSEIVAQMGELSVTVEDRFPLQTEPYTDALRVAVDGVRRDEGWTLLRDPPVLEFDEAPAPGALITVRYQIAPDPASVAE